MFCVNKCCSFIAGKQIEELDLQESKKVYQKFKHMTAAAAVVACLASVVTVVAILLLSQVLIYHL